jgi:hypothetical protein
MYRIMKQRKCTANLDSIVHQVVCSIDKDLQGTCKEQEISVGHVQNEYVMNTTRN